MKAPIVLHINLTDQSSEVRAHEDLAPLVGGLGWALALFEKSLCSLSAGGAGKTPVDSSTPQEKPFGFKNSQPEGLRNAGFSSAGFENADAEAPIVFAIGPLSGVIPGCSKTVAVFRSPQNGFLATSLGGGNLARLLRFSGYQAVAITGASKNPLIVNIDVEQVGFKNGSALVNKEVPEVFKILFGSEGVPGRRSILASGLAAEKGIAFSPLYVDEFFSFPRGGLGSVFTRKNLKGLVVSGGEGEDLDFSKRYEEVFRSVLRGLEGFEELGRQGTLRNLQVEKKISGIPFENLVEPNFDDKHQLGASFFDSRRLACGGCPVGCVHLIKHNGGYVPYNYDSVVSLGPLLGITSKEEVGQLLAKAYRIGLDPVSLGVILAYLTERGKLAFGNADTYLTLIAALLDGKEDWAKVLKQGLAEGVRTLGDEEFALVLGGLEVLPYFNGYATLLSQALSLSATTEENRGFLLDLDLLAAKPGAAWYPAGLEPEAVVSALVEEEKRKILVELFVGCGYLSSVFEETPTVFAALEALGLGVKHEELDEAVEQSFKRLLTLQKKLGFDPQAARFPARFFTVPSPQGILEEGKLKEMVRVYMKMTNY